MPRRSTLLRIGERQADSMKTSEASDHLRQYSGWHVAALTKAAPVSGALHILALDIIHSLLRIFNITNVIEAWRREAPWMHVINEQWRRPGRKPARAGTPTRNDAPLRSAANAAARP